jgi:hypothetical protein
MRLLIASNSDPCLRKSSQARITYHIIFVSSQLFLKSLLTELHVSIELGFPGMIELFSLISFTELIISSQKLLFIVSCEMSKELETLSDVLPQ